jgi:hypothetical protein
LHDLKFNEEKQILSFRAGRLGPLAIAAFRYVNLPYQTWELKPTTNGIILSITAVVMLVEFLFKVGSFKYFVTEIKLIIYKGRASQFEFTAEWNNKRPARPDRHILQSTQNDQRMSWMCIIIIKLTFELAAFKVGWS